MLKFIDKNEQIVIIDKYEIINNFRVLTCILNLENNFIDNPEIIDGNYTIFNKLSYKSIVLIFRFLSIQNDKDIEKNYDFLNFIKTLTEEEFNQGVQEAEFYSLFIPYHLYKLALRKPSSKEEDFLGEYEFLNFLIHETLASDKKADFDMLNNLIENNKWIIIDQIKDDSSVSSYKVLLRRKIQS